jgi:hypothetical protein
MDPYLAQWIQRISLVRTELAGMPVCPYAGTAQFDIVAVTGVDLPPPPAVFELIIYQLADDLIQDQVIDLARDANVKHPHLVFLPDPRDRLTKINGVQTNNGRYNLILCQPRDRLALARQQLRHTSYYSFWDKDYLNEILSL